MILITGASGFIGRRLYIEAEKRGLVVQAATRSVLQKDVFSNSHNISDIDEKTDWRSALLNCRTVVHLAARVHKKHDSRIDQLLEFRRVNVAGTLNLVRQAEQAGVRRFVYISSIGVNGSETFGKPFTADDEADPHSPYSQSKYEAEIEIKSFVTNSNMEYVIIRPPLVYGPDAPGNFASLLRMTMLGLPLPLGSVNNRRSFVSVDNLIDLILLCIKHPDAANQTFLVSDGEDLSTTDFLLHMYQALGRPDRLIPVPTSFLKTVLSTLGMASTAQSLLASLQVDIRKTQKILGWNPPVSINEGIQKSVKMRS
jgi:nucleoside-diphosphate-sugar epimerase